MMVRMPPRPMIFAVCRPLVRRASQAPAVLSGDRWVCAAGWGRVGGVDGVEGALAGRRRGRPGWPRTAAEIQHADGWAECLSDTPCEAPGGLHLHLHQCAPGMPGGYAYPCDRCR